MRAKMRFGWTIHLSTEVNPLQTCSCCLLRRMMIPEWFPRSIIIPCKRRIFHQSNLTAIRLSTINSTVNRLHPNGKNSIVVTMTTMMFSSRLRTSNRYMASFWEKVSNRLRSRQGLQIARKHRNRISGGVVGWIRVIIIVNLSIWRGRSEGIIIWYMRVIVAMLRWKSLM